MSSMTRLTHAPTLGMQQRSERLDFHIRQKLDHLATTTPHRHEYFQIQINLGGDTVQHIGGAVRPFVRHTLAFILPHRLHVIAHPPEGNFVLINFTQDFLLPQVACDAMDLEDVPLGDAPELSPFRFQEHLDFVLDGADFAQVQDLLDAMHALNNPRQLGSGLMLKGCLLQLIGLVRDLQNSKSSNGRAEPVLKI